MGVGGAEGGALRRVPRVAAVACVAWRARVWMGGLWPRNRLVQGGGHGPHVVQQLIHVVPGPPPSCRQRDAAADPIYAHQFVTIPHGKLRVLSVPSIRLALIQDNCTCELTHRALTKPDPAQRTGKHHHFNTVGKLVECPAHRLPQAGPNSC